RVLCRPKLIGVLVALRLVWLAIRIARKIVHDGSSGTSKAPARRQDRGRGSALHSTVTTKVLTQRFRLSAMGERPRPETRAGGRAGLGMEGGSGTGLSRARAGACRTAWAAEGSADSGRHSRGHRAGPRARGAAGRSR